MRQVYINEVIRLKQVYPEIVVLDADCSHSTFTEQFASKYPNSFYNVGIAEQNMIGIASGLALCKKKPIVNGFSKMLIMRALEQINDNIGISNLNVVLVGHYTGLSAAMEGSTHQMITDIAILRNIPGMNLYAPSSADDMKVCLEEALAYAGSSYIRISKNKCMHETSQIIEEGHGWNLINKHHNTSRQKLLILSYGSTTEIANNVCRNLKVKGISYKHLSIYRLNPIDEEGIAKHISESNLIIVIEEHSKIGGLAEIISTIMVKTGCHKKLKEFNINNEQLDTGTYEYLLDVIGLNSDTIVNEILEYTI